MSEVEVPRSPVEPALSLKSELEAYDRDKDRGSLLGALKEQFLLNSLVAASQAENSRNLGLQILFSRMEHMSDKMLLKTIRMLSEIGSRDLTAVTGVPVSGGANPHVLHSASWGRLPALFRRPPSVRWSRTSKLQRICGTRRPIISSRRADLRTVILTGVILTSWNGRSK